MDTTLHAQKLAILSRLIKESSLTLEEALVLLKEEESPIPITNIPFQQPAPPITPIPASPNDYWYGIPGNGVWITSTSTQSSSTTTN